MFVAALTRLIREVAPRGRFSSHTHHRVGRRSLQHSWDSGAGHLPADLRDNPFFCRTIHTFPQRVHGIARQEVCAGSLRHHYRLLPKQYEYSWYNSPLFIACGLKLRQITIHQRTPHFSVQTAFSLHTESRCNLPHQQLCEDHSPEKALCHSTLYKSDLEQDEASPLLPPMPLCGQYASRWPCSSSFGNRVASLCHQEVTHREKRS